MHYMQLPCSVLLMLTMFIIISGGGGLGSGRRRAAAGAHLAGRRGADGGAAAHPSKRVRGASSSCPGVMAGWRCASQAGAKRPSTMAFRGLDSLIAVCLGCQCLWPYKCTVALEGQSKNACPLWSRLMSEMSRDACIGS